MFFCEKSKYKRKSENSDSLNILVVCQHYFPENFLITDICESLVSHGHKVTVLTGLPNYHTGFIPDDYKHRKHNKETINGVNVLRAWELPRKNGSVINLTFNFLSFCFSACLKALTLPGNYDLVFNYQLSPILMSVPGVIYKKIHHTPTLLYCCDLWPESMKVLLKKDKSLPFSIMKFISRKIYRSSDKILVQTKYFLPYFYDTHHISPRTLDVLPQFSNDSYLDYTYESNNGVFDFVFCGNIGFAQDTATIVNAVEQIKDVKGFKVHFVGNGSYLPCLKELVEKKGLQNLILFHGRQDAAQMPKFYALADACLVTLTKNNLTGLTIPAKVQAYMAAGKMVVGAVDGAAKEVIENSNCGVCVSSGDFSSLAKAMADIVTAPPEKYSHCGKNAREYYKNNFSKKRFMSDLESHMYSLVKSESTKSKKQYAHGKDNVYESFAN